MSGRPNVEQINELREHVRLLNQAARITEDATKAIAVFKQQLQEAQDEHSKHMDAIVKLMDEMDVSSRGNHGWKNRYSVFLAELLFPREVVVR